MTSVKRMERYLPLVIGLISFVYLPGWTEQKVCWDTTWHNDSGVLKNGSTYEHQPTKVLSGICNIGPVIDAKCKDNKGEPFSKSKNDTANHYIATCTPVNGLICHPYKNITNATCPDFVIQYGCSCPTTTTAKVPGTANMKGGVRGSSTPAGAGPGSTTKASIMSSVGSVGATSRIGSGLKSSSPSPGSTKANGSMTTGSRSVSDSPTTGSATGGNAFGQQGNPCNSSDQNKGTSFVLMFILCMITVKAFY